MVGYKGIGYLFTTTPLTFGMHMTAIGFGLGSWALAAIMKTTGIKLLNIMPEFGEDQTALDKAKALAQSNFEGAKDKGEDEEEEEE
jgi:hypothetical protein